MNLYLDQLLSNLPQKNRSHVEGHSDEEIIKIESLYDIKISGDLLEFMRIAGRCDGGLIGDDPLVLYRPHWKARSHILFQSTFFDDLQNILMWDFLKKPFVFSRESETQYYFLMTTIPDGEVFHYDENTEVVKSTGMHFFEYMADVVRRYRYWELLDQAVICRGDLLNI